jgi:hypothetical protein
MPSPRAPSILGRRPSGSHEGETWGMSDKLRDMRFVFRARVAGLLAGCLGVGVLAAVGCGLISSDITKVTFDLPARTYTFDSSALGVPAGNTTAVPCGGTNAVQDCCNPPMPLPKPDCTATPIVCEAPAGSAAKVCTLEQPLTLTSTINLKMDAPELSSLSDQHLASVSLESLRYSAHSTLNVDAPPFDLYLAAQGVTDPKSAMAMKFGTIPAVKAGQSPSGDIVQTSNAGALFTAYCTDFAMPFNVLATTVVVVPSGSPTPTGAISITITGSVSAKPSL